MSKTKKQIDDEVQKERDKHKKTINQKHEEQLIKECLEECNMALCEHNYNIVRFFMHFCLQIDGKAPNKEDLKEYITLTNREFTPKYKNSKLWKALND